MIETYKQQIPEEEFVEFEAIERGESKFVVSQHKHFDSLQMNLKPLFSRKIGFIFLRKSLRKFQHFTEKRKQKP